MRSNRQLSMGLTGMVAASSLGVALLDENAYGSSKMLHAQFLRRAMGSSTTRSSRLLSAATRVQQLFGLTAADDLPSASTRATPRTRCHAFNPAASIAMHFLRKNGAKRLVERAFLLLFRGRPSHRFGPGGIA